MDTRLLVTSAGTGASGNLMRSLRAGTPSLTIVGCHDDQFLLKGSPAERNYLVPSSAQPGWARALRRIIEAERIDLVIPTTDDDVAVLARARARLGGRVFLPRATTVAVCADKLRLAERLRARRVPAPATYPVTDLRGLERIFARLGRPARAWCRIRTGAGSRGAIPVASPAQARSWIAYWRDMRGVPPTAFTLSEYLPGRDFGAQSLWRDGRLVLVKTYDRLSYLASGSQPSEVSAVGALTKTISDPRVADAAARAVRAVDRRASGVFGVDLKEDAAGVPRVTEINAGRFTSGTNLLDLTGKHNMTAVYLQLARGEAVDLHEEYEGTEHYYMRRDIDIVPQLFHADEFFDGVVDARSSGPQRRAPERSDTP
jgi:predicted ATP-grasp superfamily ATP-dependent carboligase